MKQERKNETLFNFFLQFSKIGKIIRTISFKFLPSIRHNSGRVNEKLRRLFG
ncbi:MAG TPA: hypothetical protein PKK66_05370 [Bacteroidales bacterium]|jgi:hypothetical protein|nr:hypothetical protein [Bacteroidales bacterium]HPT53071.1 hypothetical protein [Bacteroidales bacterium]